MLRVYRNPRKLDLLIGGVRMTSHPDLSLCLATKSLETSKKDPEIELVIEVCADNNDRTRNRTLIVRLV